MKKIILGILVIFAGLSVSAQIIQIDGVGNDVSGTIVDVTIDGNSVLPLEVKFVVTNNTGSDQKWRIQRVRNNVPGDWADYLCWPPSCYPTQGVQTFITPSSATSPAPTILDGTSQTNDGLTAEMKPQITPGGTADSFAEFTYYITDIAGNLVDSVGLRVFYFVGLEENVPAIGLTVSPNPATDNINVNAEGVSSAIVKVVDVLGNEVRKIKIQGQCKIDVLDLNNGVYFVILEAEGFKPVNKKIVIRH